MGATVSCKSTDQTKVSSCAKASSVEAWSNYGNPKEISSQLSHSGKNAAGVAGEQNKANPRKGISVDKRKQQLDKINELLDRIDERILIETAFNDPDKTVSLLMEARHTLVDIANNGYLVVTDWQKVADTIFLDKDIS